MNILHFALGKANPDNANGINKVINGLCKYINKKDGFSVYVVGYSKKQKEKMVEHQRDGFVVTCFNNFEDVLSYIDGNISKFDIVHLHNVWSKYNDKIAKLLKNKHRNDQT